MAYKGKYSVINKEKYRGDTRNVVYRSSWEKYMMGWFDRHPNVKWWSSETTIIPYFKSVEGRKARYFMDFTVCWDNNQIDLYEVKPYTQTQPPKAPAKMTAKAKERFINEVITYKTNRDKWDATVDICKKKGWKFHIITEKTLPAFGWKGG